MPRSFRLCALALLLGAGCKGVRPTPLYSTDGASAIKAGIGEAAASGKRVLVNVGGETCTWCARLKRFIAEDPEIRSVVEKGFVTVYIDLRANSALVSGYGEVKGIPHYFVLGPDGRLLHSQETGGLEDGSSYDRDKLLGFFKRWAP